MSTDGTNLQWNINLDEERRIVAEVERRLSITDMVKKNSRLEPCTSTKAAPGHIEVGLRGQACSSEKEISRMDEGIIFDMIVSKKLHYLPYKGSIIEIHQ